MGPILRKAIAAAGVVGLALLLALLIGEAAVRVLGLPAPPLPGYLRIANTKGTEIRPGTLALLCYPTNPRRYFQIDLRRPETAEHYRSLGMRNMNKALPSQPWAVEMKYNSAGYRGKDIPPRQPRLRRVVVIGDSFNLGWGLREEDVYTRLLERALNEQAPGGWEIVNCASSNVDFPRLWFLFKDTLVYEPDIVLYGMTLNDPIRVPRVQARLPQPAPPSVRGPFSPRLFAVWREVVEGRRYDEELHHWYNDVFSDENYNGWFATKQYIRRMQELTAARSARFVLILWPMLSGLEGRYPMDDAHRTVGEFCDKFRIDHYDLLADLHGRRSADLWVHPVDPHPNEIAQRAAAAALVPVLRRLAPPSPP